MKKKIMLFFAVCLVILPVNIKAAKVDSNKVDSKYAVTIGSVECKKKKCQFNNVRGGSGVAKARITMYSDSSTKKELSSGEVKKGINSGGANEEISNSAIGGKDGEKYTYYVVVSSCTGSTKSTCSNGDWMYQYLYKLEFTQGKRYSKAKLTLSQVDQTSDSKVSDKAEVVEEGTTMKNLTPTDRNVADIMKDDCDNNLKEIIKKYWKWVMFLTPILLIVMITLDFLKAMASGDSDSIKKSSNDAFKRVIAAIVLIMLPWALSVIFGWFGLNICF